MKTLAIRFTKKPDGTSVLACTRPDDSATWQRHRGGFFPLHDLTHYAIETVLHLRFGFYGLLAHGGNITDFGERTMPEEAQADAALAEATAGLLDQERGTGIALKAGEFNEALAAVHREMNLPFNRSLTSDELDAIRIQFMNLAGRWARLEPGEALELAFEMEP